jgi:hypothetical protein
VRAPRRTVPRRRRPRTASLSWVDWFNTNRLHSMIDNSRRLITRPCTTVTTRPSSSRWRRTEPPLKPGRFTRASTRPQPRRISWTLRHDGAGEKGGVEGEGGRFGRTHVVSMSTRRVGIDSDSRPVVVVGILAPSPALCRCQASRASPVARRQPGPGRRQCRPCWSQAPARTLAHRGRSPAGEGGVGAVDHVGGAEARGPEHRRPAWRC